MKCILALAALLIAVSSLAQAADCSPEADEVNAKCYPGNLQAAVDAALTTDRPLVMPRGTYPISKTLVIDYSAHRGLGSNSSRVVRSSTASGYRTRQRSR